MKKSVTFYFMRHGETYFNLYGRMQGWSNAPLTQDGIRDVHRSGMGLADIHFDAIYSSDLSRAIETAQIVLAENKHKDGLTIIPMKEFREVRFGFFEGLDSKEIWPKLIEESKIKYDLPEGNQIEIQQLLNTLKEIDPYHHAENYVEFWYRVESGLLKLLNRHAGTNQNILVVCHGLTIRNLLHGLVAEYNEIEPLQNASCSIVKYEKGQFQLLAYNQTSHFKEIAQEAAQHH